MAVDNQTVLGEGIQAGWIMRPQYKGLWGYQNCLGCSPWDHIWELLFATNPLIMELGCRPAWPKKRGLVGLWRGYSAPPPRDTEMFLLTGHNFPGWGQVQDVLNNVSDITTSITLFESFKINVKYIGDLLGRIQFREGLRGTYIMFKLSQRGERILSGFSFFLVSGRRASHDWMRSNFCFVNEGGKVRWQLHLQNSVGKMPLQDGCEPFVSCWLRV